MARRTAGFCAVLGWLALAGGSASAMDLAGLAAKYHFPEDSISVYVSEPGGAGVVYTHLADTPRNPASTAKLLTTFSALDLLGPSYRWKTEVFATGPLANGRLAGDLYIKGYGDPFLVSERFWLLVRGVRHTGIQRISGDLVLDSSYFQPGENQPGDFDGKPYRAYNASPSALLVNYRVVNFHFYPDEASQRLRIVADPHPDQLQIDNRVKLVAGRCRYWASRLRMLIGADGVDAHRVRFTGTYPVACGARELYRAVPGNDSYVAGLFRELWQEQGGALDGSVHTGVVPAGARRVHRQESRPLVEVIRSINKHSNNVMARQLFLTLGAERASVPGTPEGGNQAIRDWLSSRGIEPGTLYLDNGAGLSRDTRVSARQLGQVLELAWRHALMPEFLSSLPVAGVDGTLRKRHAVASLVGTAHLKTGLLEEVRAIAGYLHRPDGVRVVVVLHNHARADWRSGRQFQDAILDHFLNAPRLALTHGPAG